MTDEKNIEQQKVEISLKQLKIQERHLKLRIIVPLIVGLIALVGGVYGNYLISKKNNFDMTLANKQHCYKIIRDFTVIPKNERNKAANDLRVLLSSDIVSDCGGDLRELADLYSEEKIKIEVAVPPVAKCEKTISIKSLGWRGGHKTNFCIARGYDGVHNPFGNYSSGGFCFKGDSQACIASMTK